MSGSSSRRRAFATWSAGLLLTSALGACNGKDAPDAEPSDSGSAEASGAASAALPLSTTTPATLASAPPVTALPPGQEVRIQRLSDTREGYGYLDRAYYQEDAVEDAPPDYSFDEGGVRPWTWTTHDGARVICEPVAGGYRYYYYRAGAQSPYLVRDPQYSYAYDNGALVSVFTLAGVLVNLDGGSQPVIYAGRYLDRGNTLWRAASERPHLPVNAYAWNDRRADLAAQRVSWQRQMGGNPEWSAWNGAHHDEEQGYWNDERVQHEAAAQQFGVWQQRRFQGPPPQLYVQPGAAPGREAEPASANHTAAVVGGVVAAGVAATAAHGLIPHHGAPHPTAGPAAPPQAALHRDAGQQGVVRYGGGARPGASAEPAYAPHRAPPAAPQRVQPSAHPAAKAPEHVSARQQLGAQAHEPGKSPDHAGHGHEGHGNESSPHGDH